MSLPARKTTLRILLLLLILLISFATAISIYIPRLLDLNSYQNQIVGLLQKQLNRQVILGHSSFSWHGGPAFSFDDLRILEREGQGNLLTAGQIRFRLSILPLLAKKLELHHVRIINPQINISRNKDGLLSIADLLESSESGFDLQAYGLELKNARLNWVDQAVAEQDLVLSLSDVNLNVDKLAKGHRSDFSLTAVLEGSSTNSIKASGSFRLPRDSADIGKTDFDIKLSVNKLEYGRIWPYFGQYIPFQSPDGTLSTDMALKGRWQNLAGRLLVRFDKPELNWPTVFRGRVAPDHLQVGCNLNWQNGVLDLTGIRLGLKGFDLQGSCRLSDLDSKDLMITARASTTDFDYNQVKSYIPFGIIDDDVAEFIEKRIRGGIFRLNKGSLDARISQLVDFGLGDNADRLYINGTVRQAIVQYGEETPTFNQIKGTLEMKGKNFNLIGMTGLFGTAPCSLEGSITDYATKGAVSRYPISMTISPHPAQVAWLADHAGISELKFSGEDTILKLRGDGPVSAYNVSGEWLLDTASYSYPAIVSKPAGVENKLVFSSLLEDGDTHFKSVFYQLLPLEISGNGKLSFEEDDPRLSFNLSSNGFRLDHHLPILPDFKHYQPNGRISGQLSGSGDPRSVATMQFNGQIDLHGFSIKPLQHFDPIEQINTSIIFKGHSLETSSMSVRYKTTPLTIRGLVRDFANPETELFITSNNLNPYDFGLGKAEQEIRARKFSAIMAFKDNLLSVHNLSARLPKSNFEASGTIKTNQRLDAQFTVNGKQLDVEEIISILPNGELGDPQKPVPPYDLKVHLHTETGEYLDTSFNNLTTTISGSEQGIFRLTGLEADTMTGKLSLDGQITIRDNQPLQWDTDLKLDQVDAFELLELLGMKRDIRGKASVAATLQAFGDDLMDVRKSLTGLMAVELGKGVVQHFHTLSKLVSLLNVSQLFSLKLPDMAHDGMPFNKATATIAINRGVMTSQDLFLDSSVMHATAIGSIDLGKEQLDLMIGVQPLQAVDKLINRLPVVGWLLTGGDGSLITTYFEVKGHWSNPEVTALPVQGMASGTLGILQRAMELPVRIFTDSDKVFLGNQYERQKATMPTLEVPELKKLK